MSDLTRSEWTERAAAPSVPITIDLTPWRDRDSTWAIPVPRPFRIEGDRLVGTPGLPGDILRPGEKPQLYGDLGHIGTDPDKALAFANEYGLTAPWGAGPPLEQPLEELYAHSAELHRILEEARDGVAPDGRAVFAVIEELRASEGLVPLFQVARLYAFGDLLNGLPVHTCELEECRKLFVWTSTESRQREARRSSVKYCSIEHSMRAAQRRRRERTKEI